MESNNEIILKSLFYNKVTTPTEKIRMIKDTFKLSLKDLAGEDISTMCISNITNGKQGITEYSGEYLTKNINSLLNVNLTLGWLLEEPAVQADRLLENNINSYSKGQISIKDLEKITIENTSYVSTDLLFKAYECLIIVYKDVSQRNYSKALNYCERGIKIAFKISNFKKEVLFKHLKASIELNKGNARDALEMYEGIKERDVDKYLQFKIDYNIISCLRKLGEFEEMLTKIEVLEKTYEISTEDKCALKRMEANSLACLKEYEKALEIHGELLMQHMSIDDVQGMCIEYYNIADIYLETGELELAKKYISLRLEQKNDISIVKHLLLAATLYNDLIYIQKAKENWIEGDLNSLYNIYNKELELCIKTNNGAMLKTSLDSCIELGIKIKQPDLLLFMYDNFESEEYRKYLELFKKNKCF